MHVFTDSAPIIAGGLLQPLAARLSLSSRDVSISAVLLFEPLLPKQLR